MATAGKRQMRIAETEKYPHVTFFLNGGREEEFTGETRVLIPSPKVKTYDLQPEMSAEMVCDRLVAAIQSGDFDLIICNFANPDMVGHTGVMAAAVRAVETVDHCLGRLEAAIIETGGRMLVTADHGEYRTNARPDDGGPHTSHTTNLVPALLIGGPPQVASLRPGGWPMSRRPFWPYGVIGAGGDDRALAVGHRRWRHGGGRGGVAAFFDRGAWRRGGWPCRRRADRHGDTKS